MRCRSGAIERVADVRGPARQPIAVNELNAAMPEEVARLIRRCLEKDPAQRLQNALDLAHELEDVRAEGLSNVGLRSTTTAPPIAATVSTTSQVSVATPPRRSSRVLAGAALLLIVLSAAAYFAGTAHARSSPRLTTGAAAGPPVTVARFENRTGMPL